jgi:hypothetical protein
MIFVDVYRATHMCSSGRYILRPSKGPAAAAAFLCLHQQKVYIASQLPCVMSASCVVVSCCCFTFYTTPQPPHTPHPTHTTADAIRTCAIHTLPAEKYMLHSKFVYVVAMDIPSLYYI